MKHDLPAYGLWMVVILNSAIFLIFAFSFVKPRTERDWRTFGAAFYAYAARPRHGGVTRTAQDLP